jgi:hypothetical protein
MILQALKDQRRFPERASLDELEHKPRLPDPGLAYDQHGLAGSLLGQAPTLFQRIKGAVPADKGRQRLPALLETKLDWPRTSYLPNMACFGEAFQHLRAKVEKLEAATGQLIGRGVDAYLVRRSKRLYARRQMDRRADREGV